MKKLYTLLVVLLVGVTSLSAKTPQNSKWNIGFRAGGNIEFIGRYTGLGNVAGRPMYLEGRLGTGLPMFLIPQGTVIAAWECVTFGESAEGKFTFDAGVAVNAGGFSKDYWIQGGPMLKVAYQLKNGPLAVGLDWTPYMGLTHGFTTEERWFWFAPLGLGNIALSLSFCI